MEVRSPMPGQWIKGGFESLSKYKQGYDKQDWWVSWVMKSWSYASQVAHGFQSPQESFQPLAPLGFSYPLALVMLWEALECHSSWPTMEPIKAAEVVPAKAVSAEAATEDDPKDNGYTALPDAPEAPKAWQGKKLDACWMGQK